MVRPLRAPGPGPGGPSGCLPACFTRLGPRLKHLLHTPHDTGHVHDTKVLLFVAALVTAVGATARGALDLYVGAYVPCIFPFLLVLLSVAAVVHFTVTRSLTLARILLAWGLGLCAVATHLSLGRQAAAVIQWGFVAPQLWLFTGGDTRAGLALLGVVVAASVGSLTAFYVVPHDASLTPTHISGPWLLYFTIANSTLPWVATFAISRYTFGRLRALHELQQSLAQAEELAQKIVDFDLESIALETMAPGNGVLQLLQQVAANLQLYKPYIPGHLFPSSAPDNPSDVECPQEINDTGGPLSVVPVPHTSPKPSPRHMSIPGSPDGSPRASLSLGPSERLFEPGGGGGGGRLGNAAHANPPGHTTLRAPVRTFEVAHLLRSGTLLYVKLHKLEAYVRHGPDSTKVERFRQSANLFAEIVMAAVRETRGVLQSMQHNVCLIGWNFISTCRMHVISACHAAVMIRDRIYALQEADSVAPMNVSMGLWTGPLVSGTFGTHDFKAAGTVGYGVRRCHELQKYAVKHQRTIIANADVRDAINLNPNVRLVPVDVLEVEGAPAHTRPGDLVHGGAEIVFEVIQEVPVADDEWMYQLEAMAASRDAGDDGTLEQLLRHARDGVPDLVEYQRQLAALAVCEDPAVSRVAEALAKLALEGILAKPYRLTLTSSWERSSGSSSKQLQQHATEKQNQKNAAAAAAAVVATPADPSAAAAPPSRATVGVPALGPGSPTSSLGHHSSFTNNSPPRRVTTLALTDHHGRTTFTKSDGPSWL